MLHDAGTHLGAVTAVPHCFGCVCALRAVSCLPLPYFRGCMHHALSFACLGCPCPPLPILYDEARMPAACPFMQTLVGPVVLSVCVTGACTTELQTLLNATL